MSKQVILTTVNEPPTFVDVPPIFLTEETMEERKNKLMKRMNEESIDTVVIYADREHGANFEYLTGFIPRFEESILVMDTNGRNTLIVGNENLKMHAHSRIKTDLIHYPPFSLPNQPMNDEKPLASIFTSLNFKKKKKIGLIGWKMFSTQKVEASKLFDLPYFIVEAIKEAADDTVELINGAYLMIGEGGARRENNENELAHYEYGANLASRAMLRALNKIEVGLKETDIAEQLNEEGQTNTVVTIAAAGTRFEHANLYPTHKRIKLGDKMFLTTGFKGGLSSRTGFVVEKEAQLPAEQADYLERVAKPYFHAIVAWLEKIKIGLLGEEMYQLIESVLPKQAFHWQLNPGHLTADEEWLASPIYEGSKERLISGMIFQLDIIPSVPGYAGVSAEECVAIADETLRASIEANYPKLWERICIRRNYLKEELNICLSADVLPLSNTVAYLRPFYLAKTKALRNK